jgi:hypothetical protein
MYKKLITCLDDKKQQREVLQKLKREYAAMT